MLCFRGSRTVTPSIACERSVWRPVYCGVSHENIEDLAVLIDGTPEIIPLAPDPDEQFVEIPGSARLFVLGGI